MPIFPFRALGGLIFLRRATDERITMGDARSFNTLKLKTYLEINMNFKFGDLFHIEQGLSVLRGTRGL